MRASELPLVYAHLATVQPSFVIGTYMMVLRKGNLLHRALGKVHMLLMFTTAIFTLLLLAKLRPTILGHFGFIHIVSDMVITPVPRAYFAAKSHHVRRRVQAMIGVYIGGILVAGSLALVPGRMLHTWRFT